MSDDWRSAAADEFDEAAQLLEEAVRHLRVAADHFRNGEVPRGCAHAFAAYGRMHTAQSQIDQRAVVHADHSLA